MSFGSSATGLLMNLHNTASILTDKDITVTSVAIDEANFYFGMVFRKAENVTVQGCYMDAHDYAFDGTAFLGAENTLVEDNYVVGATNAAYDNWDGNINTTVRNNIAAEHGGYGILFNAIDTDGTARTASNFTAIGNTITGVGNEATAIYVDPLSLDAGITGNIEIIGNLVGSPLEPIGTIGPAGFVIGRTEANLVLVQGNTMSGQHGMYQLNIDAADKALVVDNAFLEDVPFWGNTLAIVQAGQSIFAHNTIVGGTYGVLLQDQSSEPSPSLYAFDNAIESPPAGGTEFSLGSGVRAVETVPVAAAEQGSQSYFATPCVGAGPCAYAQGEIDGIPLGLSCATGTMAIASATYGVTGHTISCASYLEAACNGQRGCVVVPEPSTCGSDPDVEVRKELHVSLHCSD